MKLSIEILNELKEISPLLAELERKNIFTVPDGYFDALDSYILQQIKNEKSILFSGIDEPLLKVPEGYFEALSDNILNRIKVLEKESASDELKKLSSALFHLRGINVFSVPQNYFEQVDKNILQAIKPKAKVVAMKPRSTVWKIAVAAMMTGVIAVSSLWVSQTPNKTGLAINDEDIPAVVVASQYQNEEQVNADIEKLSDDEIIKYLQTTGNASDNEAIASSIEEKELPAQQDYLTDEKTLQNYLDKIETNTSN